MAGLNHISGGGDRIVEFVYLSLSFRGVYRYRCSGSLGLSSLGL